MHFHYHMCLKRSTENFRQLMAGPLGETCSSSGINWGQPSPCSRSPGLCTSHSGVAKIKDSAAECQNPGHLWAYRQHWEQQRKPCFGSRNSSVILLASQQSRTISFLSWLYYAVCMRLRPCSGLSVTILALHLHNNLIDFGEWFSFHLMFGYNRENMF